METNNDIIEIISSLAETYESLNKRWNSAPCTTDVYQAFRQAEYHEAYENLKNVNIESLSLGIIANSLDEKVLARLRNLLRDIILIYETRQGEFTGIDFHEVYSLQEEKLFAHKFAVLAKDKEDIQDYPYPTEQERQMLLKENQKEKNLLENERSEYVRANTWMLKNFYSLIYEISKSSLSIIKSYFPIETTFDEAERSQKEKKPTEAKPVLKPRSYFDMKLVSLIHNECNNIQFENLSEIDLYSILNLQQTNAKLILKSGEKTRMCYLVYKLYEYLKTDNRREWRTSILKFIGIDEKYYDSKYKAPESEIPSRKSESFAGRINKIFDNLS